MKRRSFENAPCPPFPLRTKGAPGGGEVFIDLLFSQSRCNIPPQSFRKRAEYSMSSSIEQTQGSGAVGKSTLQQQVRGSMACIEKFSPDSIAEECVEL